MKARILLAERDRGLAEWMERELSVRNYQVSVVGDGLEGLIAARSFQPHLAIVNCLLPGLSGLELCRSLRSQNNQTQILLLNENRSIRDRVVGLDAGADDYLLIPFNDDEFLARVRSRLRRVRIPKDSHLLEFGDLRLDRQTREVYRGDRALELTAKEFDLLVYLMTHPRQVLQRQQILDRVWNDDFQGTSNIVEVYIRYLRRKLEAKRESRLIHTVHCVGYVLREEVSQPLIQSA